MEFPVYLHIGSWRIHPHVLFETLSYFIGFRVYLWTRRPSDMSKLVSLQILAGTILGAALGAKLLFWLEDPTATWAQLSQGHFLWGGKTIVGGLLGGLIGVELTKRLVGWKNSTGDDFVYPLILGIAIGRIGCFLTGLDDHTYGIATTWATGVDFGDGILRHPTQLYEMGFLMMLAILLVPLYRQSRGQTGVAGRGYVSGRMFQWFMTGYLLFRFMIEFIKPTLHPYLGLNNIQLACLAGLIYYGWLLFGKGPQQRRAVTADYSG
ncbi:prolipoprotein diacylglyceryl transferase [Paenibacillus bovis]|uniref:Diacylglyceryl transferase n=1 Tax=Paenibacillus bovis TaxID=1616788 RepID=A0A172ZIA7_9BACL|nr:prolipoprotein diacylglyceryl transferase family protein [Paenibacillus bovis]ANF97132.1 diacylglyceryl transferase [Paenibacillus bovis]